MSIYKIFVTLLFFCFLMSCKSDKITDANDYQKFLDSKIETKPLNEDLAFWENKLQKTPDEFPYLVKRSSVNTQLFGATGDIKYLKKAEKDLLVANQATLYNSAGYLKALSHNYLTQHRFKEALVELKKAEANGEKLNSTQKMLFDIYLELGDATKAESYLNKIENFSDFDYLIRLAKWKDFNGDLDAAIDYMERATKISESSNTRSLKQWAYTNLADFYGHAGKIKMSYNYYLKALELNPNDAYAKKGIAWIVYSYERNPDEALRILNHINTYYKAPDYDLLRAEIAEFKGDMDLKNKASENYLTAVNNKMYGDMYNKYNALLYTDELMMPKKAIAIAKTEVENRPTVQSYDLLAWSHYKNGDTDKAYHIAKNHVAGKTSEPEVLYHLAEIYKSYGKTNEVKPLKAELKTAIYELGPTMENKINSL